MTTIMRQRDASPAPTEDDRLVQICDLLADLRSAVDEVRAQLTKRQKPHLTVEELAELVGRSPYTIRRWISEQRIKAIRIDGSGPKGRLLIPREQLDALISQGLGAAVPDAIVGQEQE